MPAVEVLADGAERYLALKDQDGLVAGFRRRAVCCDAEEIRLRLLKRAIDRAGHEGPAELGKVETCSRLWTRPRGNANPS